MQTSEKVRKMILKVVKRLPAVQIDIHRPYSSEFVVNPAKQTESGPCEG